MTGHPQSAATKAKIAATLKAKKRARFIQQTKGWTPAKWKSFVKYAGGVQAAYNRINSFSPAQKKSFVHLSNSLAAKQRARTRRRRKR